MQNEAIGLQIINRLKTKQVKPKLYACVIEYAMEPLGVGVHLYLGVNYSLEEAVVSANKEADRQDSNKKSSGQVRLYRIASLSEIGAQCNEITLQPLDK